MRLPLRYPAALAAALLVTAAWTAAACGEDAITLSGHAYTITLSAANGSILTFSPTGHAGSVLRSGEHGLWQARFESGVARDAAEFSPASPERTFRCQTSAGGRTLRLQYQAAYLDVVVTIEAREDRLEMAAQVTPHQGVVLDFALPALLRFDAEKLDRLVCPASGNESVGTAFHGSFFQLQDEEHPAGWQAHSSGAKGYRLLYGGPLVHRGDFDAPVPLRVTEEGTKWLGPALASLLAHMQATVNRAPQSKQVDLLLVDSANGPYFSASHLGGQGFLWRIGGAVRSEDRMPATRVVSAAMAHLAAAAPVGRTRVALIALKQGPPINSWAQVTLNDWRQHLARAAAAGPRKLQFVELSTVEQLRAASAGDDFLAILNPYGEGVPARAHETIEPVVAAIGRYVRSGGNWFEVGGHPFHALLQPARYYQYRTTYPPAFADFFHWDGPAGSAAIYRAQPRTWEPWQGAKDLRAIFVPGQIACGGDEQGGWCDRPFAVYLTPKATWQSPTVRLVAGHAAADDLREYARANGVTRGLAEKMPAELLARFKASVLVYYAGNCKEKLAHLDRLPAPCQVHFAEYLHGGFDKQYPDHLPPNPNFGTPEEFREFFDRGHRLGHLMMPYTNPTWWCEGPKGPTFERYRDAPLLVQLNGHTLHEQYSKNGGFTICHWHPAVQEANRKTVEQFSRDYPCDVLFQDQCGARTWHYDRNPQSPTVAAYTEGLLSMVAEDCRRKPLSTESGWDGVVNFESQLCGMSWRIVPTEGGPPWRTMFKSIYDPAAWEVFPVAQYIAHDKVAMIHHDLGQFVTNRETLAWTLGLGYSLSYRASASSLESPGPRQWLLWLDRLQKSVCRRYVGEPLLDFSHDRGPGPAADDDGLLRARYASLGVVANLSPRPREVGEAKLAPWGFYSQGPGWVAGDLQNDLVEDDASFVAEGDAAKADVWIYGRPGQSGSVLLPAEIPGALQWRFDGLAERLASGRGRTVCFTLPQLPGTRRAAPPAELAGKAPRDWPTKPAIALVDLDGLHPTWTRITAADWRRALEASKLTRQFGLPIVRIRSAEELVAKLQAGPTQCLAIINPYGEQFPVLAAGDWRTMLERIRAYVDGGGCWWETAGHSFSTASWRDGGRWRSEHVGPQGLAGLRLPLSGGEIDEPPQPLCVPAEGRAWLDEALIARVQGAMTPINRGLARGDLDPGHVSLVAGREQDWIGGYRLDGWGWLWRIGGFWPNPEVALPVSIAALEYLATQPPLPIHSGGVKYLWHAQLRAE
jgi:hypothetical protein